MNDAPSHAEAAGRTLPARLRPALRAALTDARRQLEALYGDRLRRVMLYGSQARGDATPESDADVLVVLGGALDVYAETARLADLGLTMFSTYGTYFSFKPFTVEDFQDPTCPFMRSARADGIDLFAGTLEQP